MIRELNNHDIVITKLYTIAIIAGLSICDRPAIFNNAHNPLKTSRVINYGLGEINRRSCLSVLIFYCDRTRTSSSILFSMNIFVAKFVDSISNT